VQHQTGYSDQTVKDKADWQPAPDKLIRHQVEILDANVQVQLAFAVLSRPEPIGDLCEANGRGDDATRSTKS